MNRLAEIYQYREMMFSLIKRDLRGKYKASVLGFLWTFLNPLFQLLVYTIVFSVILHSTIEHFYIYLFVGLVPWTFFSTCVSAGASCIVNQESLIKKIYFPRIVLPISFVTSAFINMLLTFMVIFAVLFISGYGVSIFSICFLPIIMLIEYILALGICMVTSALVVYFRDLEYILGIVTMAWMYMTPILYSVEIVPEEYQSLYYLNPMTPIIQAYQQILYYKKIPQLTTLMQAIGLGIVILVLGSFLFEKMQKKFVEEL